MTTQLPPAGAPRQETVFTWNPRILKMPYVILAILVGYAAWQQNWWLLFGLPFIYVGWFSAAPNLNLINGCLPQLILIAGLIGAAVLSRRWPLEIAAVCWVSWLVLSLEEAYRLEPVRSEPETPGGDRS